MPLLSWGKTPAPIGQEDESGEDKNSLPCLELNLHRPTHSLETILTELP